MISQAQKIDCRAFVGEIYFRFFRNRLIQQNHLLELQNLAFLTLHLGVVGFFHTAPEKREIFDYGVSRKENYILAP